MNEETTDKDTMWVVTSEPIVTRGVGTKQAKPLKAEVLAENINLFIWQMGNILEKTPEKLVSSISKNLRCMLKLRVKGQ